MKGCAQAMTVLVVCFIVLQSNSLYAADDAFYKYSEAYAQFQKDIEQSKSGGVQGKSIAAVNFTGAWSSNSQYIADAKVVDDNGMLSGIVKVPNGNRYDMYHFAGFYYNGTVYLGHFTTSGSQLFIGTLNGTSISGYLNYYDGSNNFLGSLTGIVLTKNVAQGALVASTSLNGKWGTKVLSVPASGAISSTVASVVGENVAMLSGNADVFYTPTASPYHFIGYMLDNGEVFLYNSNGVDARTLLGTYANGVITGVLEQDAVTADANAALVRQAFPVSIYLLMDKQ